MSKQRRRLALAGLVLAGGALAQATPVFASQLPPASETSPDGHLRAVPDPADGLLLISDTKTGRQVAALPLPGGRAAFGSSENLAAAQAFWSPDGKTIAVTRKDDIGVGETHLWLVDVGTDSVVNPPYVGFGATTVVWGSDGREAFFVEPAVVIRVALDGTSTELPTTTFSTAAGAPQLGGTPEPVTTASVVPDGNGTVSVTATVPPSDTAGVWIRDAAGRGLGWLPASGTVRIVGLHPSETYHLSVVGQVWDGAVSAALPVTVRTAAVPATITGIAAPSYSKPGKSYAVTASVLRADTGKPLHGRTVLLKRNGKTLARGKTNALGEVVFHVKGAGNVRLQAVTIGDRHDSGSPSPLALVVNGSSPADF